MAETSGSEIIYLTGDEEEGWLHPTGTMNPSLGAFLTGSAVPSWMTGIAKEAMGVGRAVPTTYDKIIKEYVTPDVLKAAGDAGIPIGNVRRYQISPDIDIRDPERVMATDMPNLVEAIKSGEYKIPLPGSPEGKPFWDFVNKFHKDRIKAAITSEEKAAGSRANTQKDFPLSSAIRDTGVGTGSPILDELFKKSENMKRWESENAERLQ